MLQRKASTVATSVRDLRTSGLAKLMLGDSVTKIEDALDQRAAQAAKSLKELERHGANLAVTVVLHGDTFTVRCCGYMTDNWQWAQFLERMAECTRLHPKDVREMSFWYLDDRQAPVVLTCTAGLRKWLDDNWIKHPLEIHCRTAELTASMRMANDAKLVRECFAKYDTDGSGSLSTVEMSAMLTELCTSVHVDATLKEIDIWVQHEIDRADMDKSGTISFAQFAHYYSGLRDFIKDFLIKEIALAPNSYAMRQRYDETHVEARSYRRTLSDVFQGGGSLSLDANGHDYAVELNFDKAEAERASTALGDELKAGRWVRAQTLLDRKVENLVDHSGVAIREARLAPIVLIEFEDLTGPDRYHKAPPFSLTMPHCLEVTTAQSSQLVVVRAELDGSGWEEVDAAKVELLPHGSDGDHGGHGAAALPALRISLDQGGIYTAFARARHRCVQRIHALVYLPEKIIPIKYETLRVHVVPDLPEHIETCQSREQTSRGMVHFSGRSPVAFAELPKAALEITINQPAPRTTLRLWVGEPVSVDFPFSAATAIATEPAASPAAAPAAVPAAPAAVPAGPAAVPPVECTVALAEGASGVERAGDIGGSRANEVHAKVGLTMSLKGIGSDAASACTCSFDANILVHMFRPPSPCTYLRCESRTNVVLTLQWDIPAQWGGCALKTYEIQMHDVGMGCRSRDEASGKGPPSPTPSSALSLGGSARRPSFGWKTIFEGLPDANVEDKGEARIFMNVYSALFRVRAYNIGCQQPSEWSEVLTLGTVKEEHAKKAMIGTRARVSRRSRLGLFDGVRKHKEKRASTATSGSSGGVTSDGGLALVDHGSVSDGIGDLFAKNMDGWTAFGRTLGHLFLELGVPGGVRGRLFDLTIAQMESLARGDAVVDEGNVTPAIIDADANAADVQARVKPLMALISSAVWVMSTLASHTDRPDGWLRLMSDVDGLTSLVTCNRLPYDEKTLRFISALIVTLVEIFETMRQCEPDGFITCTLKSSQLSESRRTKMLSAYKARIEALQVKVATHVMAMMLHERVNKLNHSGLLLSRMTRVHAAYAQVFLSRVSAEMHGGLASPRVRVAFSLVHLSANDGPSSLDKCTLECGRMGYDTDLTQPSWPDEMVVLDGMGTDSIMAPLPRPLELRVKLCDEGRVLGTATLHLSEASGHVAQLSLGVPADVAAEAVTAGSLDVMLDFSLELLASVSFSYCVAPWIEAK